MPEDYYQILGVDYQAGARAIQKAFHQLAKRLHPDKNPGDHTAEEKFKLVSEAYKTLSDPAKKYQYDLKLKYGAYSHFVASTAKYQARKRPPVSRSFYRRHRSFSRGARVWGGISIVGIVMIVALITVYLTRYNARYDFQRGLTNYHNKRYSSAYFNLKESLTPLNPYLAATYLLLADICFHHQQDLSLTRNHIKKGYQADPSDSINARLLYLEGKVDYRQGNYQEAYQRFEEATMFLAKFDSATYKMGEMDLFLFGRFNKALGHFQTLIENDPNNYEAYLASAYCYQQLNQHQKVITQIDKFLSLRSDVGMAYYIKGVSAQLLKLKDIACANYLEAQKLGVSAASDSLNTLCRELRPI